MKYKKLFLTSILTISLVVLFIVYYDSSVMKRSLIETTGLEDFTILMQENSDYDCSMTVLIARNDRSLLVKNFHFSDDINKKMVGHISNTVIPTDTSYLYSFSDWGMGLYGYKVLALSKTSDTLIYYHFFGE